MVRGLLKEESFEKICDYMQKGMIEQEKFISIVKSKNHKDLLKSMSFFQKFNLNDVAIYWLHVIENYWIGVQNQEEKTTVFNENENIFFRELLKNNGQLTRKYSKNKIFNSSWVNDKTTSILEEMGIIDIFKLTNNEVVYSLSLSFMQEVTHSEK